MEYILHTTVDITNTGQYRTESGKEALRWKEQNFQTVLQTIGIRGNVQRYRQPTLIEIAGHLVGFATTDIIHVWRFEFETERENIFEDEGNPVKLLEDTFNGVPYISGLDESMLQNFDVFVTDGPSKNIVFQIRQ